MTDKKYIVYQIQNIITKEKYIGMTSQNLNLRFKNGKGYKKYTKINQAIEKYGWQNFEHKILFETVNAELAGEKEKYYIKKYNTIKNGYNKQLGGLKSTSYEITKLHREHMSQTHKGKHNSPSTEFKIGREATNKKKVVCVETNMIYNSLTEASNDMNIGIKMISRVCNNLRKKTHGYHFNFIEEVNNV